MNRVNADQQSKVVKANGCVLLLLRMLEAQSVDRSRTCNADKLNSNAGVR